jgi:hypothetical protein
MVGSLSAATATKVQEDLKNGVKPRTIVSITVAC